MINISKLDRPPTVENWSRMQYPEVMSTARSLFRFVKGGPVWNYGIARNCARYYIEDRISRETAETINSTKGSSLGRPYNEAAIDAFFDYVEEHPIEGVRAFDQFVENFPLGPGVYVPIKPLAVVRDAGVFSPIFLNPWSNIAFDEYQARLYMTILEKSIYSLTDFESSSGKIIFLPKLGKAKDSQKRKAVVWKRGDHRLLTDKDLNEQIRIFSEGKKLAAKWVAELDPSE